MADVIHAQRGFSPWAPSPDAYLVKEYRFYDIPLVGVVTQQGVRYLFVCLAGQDEPVSFWLYAHLSAEDEERLDAADPDTFGEAVDFVGSAVLALAIEGPGIIGSVVLDELSDPDSLRFAARRLVDQLDSLADAAKDLELTT